MATLSITLLSLDLPSTRMSVDFSTFALETTKTLISRRPLPPLKTREQHPEYLCVPLPELKEVPELISTVLPQRSARQAWRRPNSDRKTTSSPAPAPALSRTSSNASTLSTASTAVAPVFSRVRSSSTSRTSNTFSYHLSSQLDVVLEARGLLSLPLSLVEHILTYALDLPAFVSIGPPLHEHRHMQHRYNHESLEHLSLGQFIRQPLFLVSHRIREIAVDISHRKAEFVIDLSSIYYTKVASTVNDNLKRHRKFWTEYTPRIVQSTLWNLSKLQIRLPVPSTEAAVYRGREAEDWMDGSDGQGGGSWRAKSTKREQEDAASIQQCLESIVKYTMTVPQGKLESQGLRRSLSLRRNRSVKKESRRSSAYEQYRRGPYDQTIDRENESRKPLKRLEVVLVKRSLRATILPDSLNLVRGLRSIQVSGHTKYHFELNGRKFIWATRYKRKWLDLEPNGVRLLKDLQAFAIEEAPIELIQTPRAFKFVNVDRHGQLQLLDTALPKTPIVLESAVELPLLPPITNSVQRKNGLFGKKTHRRNSSFDFVTEKSISNIGSTGGRSLSRKEPPTIEELQQIAEEIRKGTY